MDIVKLSNTIVDGCNNIGGYAIKKCEKLARFEKSFDSYVSNTKFESLKGKVSTKTLLGAGIVVTATTLATKAIMSLKKEISRIKNK